jgi:hypothetical protein
VHGLIIVHSILKRNKNRNTRVAGAPGVFKQGSGLKSSHARRALWLVARNNLDQDLEGDFDLAEDGLLAILPIFNRIVLFAVFHIGLVINFVWSHLGLAYNIIIAA